MIFFLEGCVVGLVVGLAWGGVYMQRMVKANAEHAVRQDYRVSLDRKAAIIARIRGCPMEWVLEEFENERAARAKES